MTQIGEKSEEMQYRESVIEKLEFENKELQD